MVELPQELVPGATEITDVPPLDVATLPAISAAITSLPTVQTEKLPPAGLKRLYGPAQPVVLTSPPASPLGDTIYTVQSSPPLRTEVLELIVCNTTGVAAKFSLSIGTIIAANELFDQKSVAANETEILPMKLPLVAGESLHAEQFTSNALTITIVGTELPA